MHREPHVVEEEGVTKFHAQHTHCTQPLGVPPEQLGLLLGWRTVLFDLRGVGQDPRRYGGAGFGNVSMRSPGAGTAFVVTGTQTGGKRVLTPQDLAWVESHDVRRNRVKSRGPVMPSSESMTHGTLYEHGVNIQWVFHVHAPQLWNAATALGIPQTPPGVAYGTPRMAQAVDTLFQAGPLRRLRIFSMAGHEDGIISFGETAQEAGMALMAQWARVAGQ